MGNREENQNQQDEMYIGKVMRSYRGIIAVILTVVVLVLLIYFFLSHFTGFFSQIGVVMKALQAVVIGVVIAYIVCPIMNAIERKIKPYFEKKIKKPEKALRTARSISVAVTLVLVLAFMALLFAFIVPEISTSIATFMVALPDNMEKLTAWLQGLSNEENVIAEYALTGMNNLLDYMNDYLDNMLNNQMGEFIKSITTGALTVGKFLLNCIVGFVVAIYVLFDKDKFLSQAKKLTCTIFTPKAANVVLRTTRETHEIFIGFIVGKIIDSVIIGVLTYIVLVIFSMPYAMLAAVIVGVTNVIPFFGPFVGAIPSFFLILLADPIKGLIFLPLILIIQQVDGNIIGPKILGESTGLSTFWVIVAILFSGGLFGFAGMLLGVPLFAAIANIIRKILNYYLERKDLPTNTEDYVQMQSIDPESGKLCYDRVDMDHPHAWQFFKRRKYEKEQEEKAE